MKKYNLSNDFEFSQAYLFCILFFLKNLKANFVFPVFDKLEKANFFLETVLDTLDEDVNGRLLQHLLKCRCFVLYYLVHTFGCD
jgi:bleomycin hydrolase